MAHFPSFLRIQTSIHKFTSPILLAMAAKTAGIACCHLISDPVEEYHYFAFAITVTSSDFLPIMHLGKKAHESTTVPLESIEKVISFQCQVLCFRRTTITSFRLEKCCQASLHTSGIEALNLSRDQ
jgi:hypothetical protein